MTSLRPRAVVTTPGGALSSAQAALAWLRIGQGRQGAHDLAELVMGARSRLGDLAPGDTLTLALGEEGAEELVFSGEVSDVIAGPDSLRIEAFSATVALSRQRKSQAYLDQTVADIVRDLAEDLAVARAEGDARLAAYMVDDRRPVWAHLLALAGLAGADVGSAADGGLDFGPAREGAADATLRYGADLLAFTLAAGSAPAIPAVAAHGAGSEQGEEHWHWLCREPSPAGAGPLRVVGGFHTRAAADGLRAAVEKRAQRAAVTGELLVVGRPALRPAQLIELDGLPGANPGPLRVLAVDHTLGGRQGFVSWLRVEGAGGGGGPP